MDKRSITSDIPQIVLDELNRVNFKAIGMIKKKMMMTLIKSQASSYPQKAVGVKSTSGETKNISDDFDRDLLDVLERCDWSQISPQLLDRAVSELKKHVGSTIPAKKA